MRKSIVTTDQRRRIKAKWRCDDDL